VVEMRMSKMRERKVIVGVEARMAMVKMEITFYIDGSGFRFSIDTGRVLLDFTNVLVLG
jgi:hypothetical protein